jgi:hypothetical protein
MHPRAHKIALKAKRFRFLALSLAVFCLATSAVAKEMNYDSDDDYKKSVAQTRSTFFDYSARYSLQNYLVLSPSGIPDLLKSLPKALRMSYTLQYNSGSIQGAFYENPRVIMFSPTADLVLSFNGHENMVGGDQIEAMAYDDVKDQYVFHEISFSEHVVKNVINPHKCQACHTDSYIPNWRGYNTWTGAYGGLGDRFDEKILYVKQDGRPAASLKDADDYEEFHHFLAFSRSMSTNGDRYPLLVNSGSGELWPFQPGVTDKSYVPAAYWPNIPAPELDYEPNRRLTLGLVYRLSRMLGARLKRSQLYKNYPANIVSQLLECDTDPQFTRILQKARESSVLRYGDIDYDFGPLKPILTQSELVRGPAHDWL